MLKIVTYFTVIINNVLCCGVFLVVKVQATN